MALAPCQVLGAPQGPGKGAAGGVAQALRRRALRRRGRLAAGRAGGGGGGASGGANACSVAVVEAKKMCSVQFGCLFCS